MKVGTKSVLFGAHQFLLHPLFVALAWWQLYGFPWDPRLWVAFFVHDLGYWGKPNMDGEEGELHAHFGAVLMHRLFDRPFAGVFRCQHPDCDGQGDLRPQEGIYERPCPVCAAVKAWSTHWHDFTLYHSRFMARRHDRHISRLCIADKLAGCLEPDWLYLVRVILTGEIDEYMDRATHKEGGKYRNETLQVGAGRLAWRRSVKAYLLRWVAEHRDGRADTWTPSVPSVP